MKVGRLNKIWRTISVTWFQKNCSSILYTQEGVNEGFGYLGLEENDMIVDLRGRSVRMITFETKDFYLLSHHSYSYRAFDFPFAFDHHFFFNESIVPRSTRLLTFYHRWQISLCCTRSSNRDSVRQDQPSLRLECLPAGEGTVTPTSRWWRPRLGLW